MCFYVQKLYHVEIIRMKVEFAQDENNTIWMQHASDIRTQNNETAIRALQEKQRIALKM